MLIATGRPQVVAGGRRDGAHALRSRGGRLALAIILGEAAASGMTVSGRPRPHQGESSLSTALASVFTPRQASLRECPPKCLLGKYLPAAAPELGLRVGEGGLPGGLARVESLLDVLVAQYVTLLVGPAPDCLHGL